MQPFTYKNKGTLAIIGRMRAVADLPAAGLQLSGPTAMLIWLFVHLFSLISTKNRLCTLSSWTYAWFNRNEPWPMSIRPAEKVDGPV